MSGLEDLYSKIESYRPEIIEMQRELTSRPALSPENGGNGEHDKAEYVKEQLLFLKPGNLYEIHAPDERAANGYRPNLVATWKGSREGKAIGINTAMIMGAQNIGFAIPINYAKKDLEEVQKYGKIKFPFLGIKYILITKEMANRNKLPVDYGVLIMRESLGESPIVKGSAAEKAGFKEFDIILQAKGEKITLKNSLAQILQKCKIGEEIELNILRGKKKITLRVELEEKK